jgi:hypothetical protein
MAVPYGPRILLALHVKALLKFGKQLQATSHLYNNFHNFNAFNLFDTLFSTHQSIAMAPTAAKMRAYMASSIPPPPRDPATGLIDFNFYNSSRGAFEALPTDIRG